MKTGISLTALAAKIEAQRDLKHDLIAPTAQTTVETLSLIHISEPTRPY